MQLYCPACKTAAAAAERCTRCGERLVAPSELTSLSRDQLADAPPDLIQTTTLGRVVVGVVVALGLCVSLRELSLGAAAAADLSDAANSGVGNWLLRAVSILAGALLAGAGRLNGVATGGATALTCVVLLVGLDFLAAVKTGQPEGVIAGGVCLAALAAGRIGSTVWPAAVPLPPSKIQSRGSSLIPLKDDDDGPRPVALSWARVGLGVAVAVVGVLISDGVRTGLRSVAGQGLFLGSPTQSAAVDFFLGGVAIMLGGVVAGGGSGAGLRHGVVMGVIAAAGLATLSLAGKESAIVPLTGLLEVVGYPSESPRTANGLVVVVAGVTTLGALSGGFGGLLLPRLAVKSRRRAYQD